MGRYSKQLTACILNDWVLKRNKTYHDDFRVEINRFVEVYAPDGKRCCTGNFIDHLFEFCKETFHETPCLSCFDGQISFYL